MALRGIRGAVNCRRNSREEIFARTQELLQAMQEANGIKTDAIAAAFFTLTPDLSAEFPAYAARDLGWRAVPMLCAQEIAVPGSLQRVIRILLLVETRRPARSIRHQYLGDTSCLRPDLATPPGVRRSSLRS